ncbi:uncharacterized protein LOC120290230 [Eucalyptus grandis]|uniref:uncharacterized protein LOC120290230 n=1 Tax=Eucalyptus grandis TaxID=71139 RepID=UPI00192F10FB|nr:uncharacterized protein LOC120290230 [Eucalyptus grandis]
MKILISLQVALELKQQHHSLVCSVLPVKRVFLMENNNYPQTYPSFQYFPPPSAWIDPDSISSNDNKTPTWVIVGVVIVAVMLCGFLFYYIRRREKKIWKKVALASASATKPSPPASPIKDLDLPEEPGTKPWPGMPPPMMAPIAMAPPITIPGDCQICGHRGGRYYFKYTCPECRHKLVYDETYPND